MESVPIHPLSHDPTAAWEQMQKEQTVRPLGPKELLSSDKHCLRFVCMSDTHNTTSYLPFEIPDGDVYLHAGDFTRFGSECDVQHFDKFLGTLPHKHKIVIAGNHEIPFDKQCNRTSMNDRDPRELIRNATYLEDSFVLIEGIKIYGSPWQPEFCSWAFNLRRGKECLEKWDLIPDDVDILVTHGPPLGHGDLCHGGCRAGCVELLTTVQTRVKPAFHVYGHIHEGYSVTTDGTTVFINASTCNLRYKPTNSPVVFDFPLRCRKQNLLSSGDVADSFS